MKQANFCFWVCLGMAVYMGVCADIVATAAYSAAAIVIAALGDV